MDLRLDNITFKIVNINGPNVDTPCIYENLNNIVQHIELDYTIICGDFNHVLNSKTDCYNK